MSSLEPPLRFWIPVSISLISLAISGYVAIYNVQQARELVDNTRFDAVIAADESLRVVQKSGDYSVPVQHIDVTAKFLTSDFRFIEAAPRRMRLTSDGSSPHFRVLVAENFISRFCANQAVANCGVEIIIDMVGRIPVDGSQIRDFQIHGIQSAS
ncbi:MAG: hypothetical protein QNJ44_14710 [Rhodobacter sp.]|nr:hypothetical protein [Rhodobacter sp.]